MGTAWLPRANERFFCHVKEDTDFRRGVLACAAQATTGIAKKSRFWTGTSSFVTLGADLQRPFCEGRFLQSPLFWYPSSTALDAASGTYSNHRYYGSPSR